VSVPIRTVDAFAGRPFEGNPAGVCLLEAPADERWMAAVAREMNLSETAFVGPEEAGWSLRWFTPATEVDLCGHATLAAAHVMWEERLAGAGEPIRFHTRGGILTATRHDPWIELDFPAAPPRPAEPPSDLVEAIGGSCSYVGRSALGDHLLLLDTDASVRALKPDLRRLADLPGRGTIVTAPADDEGFDFVSRFFAPGVGVDEDPVTGSAHCTLGPYWSERLGRGDLVGYQASRRGGTVRVRTEGERVVLGGRAVTVLRGEIVGPDR